MGGGEGGGGRVGGLFTRYFILHTDLNKNRRRWVYQILGDYKVVQGIAIRQHC